MGNAQSDALTGEVLPGELVASSTIPSSPEREPAPTPSSPREPVPGPSLVQEDTKPIIAQTLPPGLYELLEPGSERALDLSGADNSSIIGYQRHGGSNQLVRVALYRKSQH